MRPVAPPLFVAIRSMSRASFEERAAIIERLPTEQRPFARVAFEAMCSVPRRRPRG